MKWTPTTTRMATEADADEHGEVWWRKKSGRAYTWAWDDPARDLGGHWMTPPPLAPEPTGETVEVRVAVVMDTEGKYYAAGWTVGDGIEAESAWLLRSLTMTDPVILRHSVGDKTIIHVELARPWSRKNLDILRQMLDIALKIVEQDASEAEQLDAGFDPIALGV